MAGLCGSRTWNGVTSVRHTVVLALGAQERTGAGGEAPAKC